MGHVDGEHMEACRMGSKAGQRAYDNSNLLVSVHAKLKLKIHTLTSSLS